MRLPITRCVLAAVVLAAVSACSTPPTTGPSQPFTSRDEALEDHLRVIEGSARGSINDVVADFEANRLSPELVAATSAQERRALIRTIRRAARRAGDVSVAKADGATTVTLAGRTGTFVVTVVVEEASPFRIVELDANRRNGNRRDLGMTPDNIDEVITTLLEKDEFAGVVYLAIDGEEVHRAAYGVINPDDAQPVALDTIFGIGSRPIDFTVAAILLLTQRGEVSLEDPISLYFDDVPPDKREMTLRHLMTGRSGLPDFHGLRSDWDQDLAWIDRAEAERRILAQRLLFSPGRREAPSHSAFGLLASVVERASGTDYMTFLTENFFEPAGMDRTGEYGSLDGHGVSEFAVGRGPSFVGEPNIPPNWGPTSWLVKGSGGMYSTLDDLLSFYCFVRTSGVLERRYARWFLGSAANIDGSERGFELFSAYDEDGDDTAFLFMAVETPSRSFTDAAWALESLVFEN